MKTKQVLSVSLIAIMLFLLLTGCGGKTGAVDSSADTTAATAGNTTASNTTVEQTKEPVMVLKCNLHSNGSNYYTTMTDTSKDKYIKKIEELTNIRLDVIVRDHEKSMELLNLMFASGDIPDIVSYASYSDNTPLIKQAIKNGVFLNLKPYINAESTPNLFKTVPEEAWKEADEFRDGSIYFVPMYTKYACDRALYIRQDLLDKYNLAVPKTIDELTNVLKIFKKNGLKYPLTARSSVSNLDAIFGAFGVGIGKYIITDTGKLEPADIQPGMKQSLSYLRDLYAGNLLDPEFLTNTLDPFSNKILSGDVGVFMHGAGNYPTWQDGIVKNIPDAKFTMMLAPTGPDGKAAIGPNAPAVDTMTFVNKDVKDPARIAKYFDWMCTDEAAEFFSYGIEGDTYTKTSDGKVNFTYPTEQKDLEELWARIVNLWFVNDYLDNPRLAPYKPYTDLVNEYRARIQETGNVLHSVSLLGDNLEIYQTSPELMCGYDNSCLFQQIAINIIFGKAEVDDFDKWVEDWKKRGGDKVLEQLEKKRAANEYASY